ncbi:conjugal transfer protein TraH, partial [Vibrio parahaemolyticus]|nr:conjugal transfer protein TraH [Vibrio parahaemolyticus]
RYLANMLNVVQSSLANTQVNHKDIALITRDIDRAKRFTDGLADKATQQLLEQEQLIQAHKSNDQKAWQKLSEQLQQN